MPEPPSAATGGAVEARGLGKRYDGTWALRGLDLDVAAGTILGIVGGNGAGKTTTMKILAGLLEPSEGAARVAGADVAESGHRANVGYLPEESALYDEMTANQYLAYFADLYSVRRRDARDRVRELLALLRLDDTNGKRLGDMSKGMRRKVAIARTLVHEPRVLLYDEPASGLDPLASHTVLDLLQKLKRAGRTILFSAHNLHHVERLANDILILHRGRTLAHGTMDAIRRQFGATGYAVRLTAAVPGSLPVGDAHEVLLPDLTRLTEIENQARAAGGALLDVRPAVTTLEEIFLRSATG